MAESITLKKTHVTIIAIAVLAVIIGGAFFLLKDKSITGFATLGSDVDDTLSEIEEIHFPKSVITYSLHVNTSGSHVAGSKAIPDSQNTDKYKIERIHLALDLVEEASDNSIEFRQVADTENPDITIYGVPEVYCYEEGEEYDGRIEGLAGPLNVSGKVIINSSIVYCAPGYSVGSRVGFSWYYGSCEEYPLVEVHEILHALGFAHVNDIDNVMYPVKLRIRSCEVKSIDEKISSCLKHIYSNGEKEGTCEGLDMYPWSEENLSKEDFKWESLPIDYTVFGCNEEQVNRLKIAENVIEKQFGREMLEFKTETSNVQFYCRDGTEDVELNLEADQWEDNDYFVAAQPIYSFDENGKIEKVKVYLFGQDKPYGGIEFHEFMHVLGLRNHYGEWMLADRPIMLETGDGRLDKESIDKLKEIYPA